MLEKQGLHHAEPILEEYGIGSETDVLKIFKLCEHPEIRPQIDVMKTEVMTYQAFARLTPSSHSRKGRIGSGRALCTLICGSQTLQHYQHSRTCCTVLTNSPKSCPPERLFSILNATYNDDQKSPHTDYIQLSMQSQFNKRVL